MPFTIPKSTRSGTPGVKVTLARRPGDNPLETWISVMVTLCMDFRCLIVVAHCHATRKFRFQFSPTNPSARADTAVRTYTEFSNHNITEKINQSRRHRHDRDTAIPQAQKLQFPNDNSNGTR